MVCQHLKYWLFQSGFHNIMIFFYVRTAECCHTIHIVFICVNIKVSQYHNIRGLSTSRPGERMKTGQESENGNEKISGNVYIN